MGCSFEQHQHESLSRDKCSDDEKKMKNSVNRPLYSVVEMVVTLRRTFINNDDEEEALIVIKRWYQFWNNVERHQETAVD